MKTRTKQATSPRTRMLHALADQVEAAHRVMLESLRPLYLAELEAFAETLRAGFEAGQLYGYRETEEGGDDYWGEKRLEGAIDVFFGLEVTRVSSDPKTWRGDEHAARAILALSPSVELMGRAEVEDYTHPALAARDCVLYDVLKLARARRWYRPTKDEGPDVLRRSTRRAA